MTAADCSTSVRVCCFYIRLTYQSNAVKLCSLTEIRRVLLSDRVTLESLLDMATGINENIQRVGASVEVSQTEVRRDMADLVTRIERLLDSNVPSGEGTVNSEEVCRCLLLLCVCSHLQVLCRSSRPSKSASYFVHITYRAYPPRRLCSQPCFD